MFLAIEVSLCSCHVSFHVNFFAVFEQFLDVKTGELAQ